MKKAKPPAEVAAAPPEPSPEERIDWLLKFLQRDVAALRVGELIDLGTDVVRYLLDPRATISPAADRTGKEDITEDVVTLKRPLLQKLQDTLRAGLQRLEEGKDWWPFDAHLAAPQMLVQRRADGTLDRRYPIVVSAGLLDFAAGAILAALVASAVDLLVQAEIRRCAYEPCGKLFRPTHGRQHYHDPKCSKLKRWYRLPPKPKRDYKQELVNANRREKLKKNKKRGTS